MPARELEQASENAEKRWGEYESSCMEKKKNRWF
jgi:hypothetical protein